MGFELFARARRPRGEMVISLTKNGSFNVGSVAYEEYFKRSPYVLVYWDSKRRVIGLKPTAEKKPEAYEVHARDEGKAGNFSGVAFIKYIGLKVDKTLAIRPAWNEKEGLLELPLP